MRKKRLTESREYVENAIRLGAFLLVWISGIALFLTQKLYGSSLLLIGISLVAWLFTTRPSKSGWWDFAAFLYLFFFFFDWIRLSGSLAAALVHLFIFIIVNKIFNLHSERDYYQLYLLTFLSMLAASSLSVEVEIFYMIIVYVALMIWNVIAVTLWKEWKSAGSTDPFPFSMYGFGYWSVVVVTALVAISTSMAIFFLMPRMQVGLFASLSTGKTQHVSGFSSTVELGDVAGIAEDPEVAMRVRVSSKTPLEDLRFYWRGIAFDYYDGKSWSTANPGTRFLYQDSSDFFYTPYFSRAEEGLLVKQEFYMAPLDTRVIFGLDRIAKIQGSFVGVSRDMNATLTSMNRTENYVVYSRIPQISKERLRDAQIRMPEPFKRYYLQLPFRSSRIENLARSIVGNVSTTYDQIAAVEEFLEKNYQYSTTDLPQGREDPISAFLFEKKTGHCEYFASSMVLLLRTLGIPARLVNGFLQGEYNEIGGFYLVRHSDAHSWVEVFLDGAWVPFDPSPRAVSGGLASWFRWFNLRKIGESVTFFWDRYILIFSAQDQMDALNVAREKYDQISKKVLQTSKNAPDQVGGIWQRTWQKYGFGFACLLGILVLTALLVRFYRMKRRRLRTVTTPILFYREMLSILEKKGFPRPPQATPVEFIHKLGRDIPEPYVSDLFLLTDLFYRSRFGKYPLSMEEQRQVRFSLQRLEHL